MEGVELSISGRVQGVGFRYFTLNAAIELDIVGWVRNMPDGTVLCRAAGTPDALALFCDRLREGPPFGRTDHIQERSLPRAEAESFVAFQILH